MTPVPDHDDRLGEAVEKGARALTDSHLTGPNANYVWDRAHAYDVPAVARMRERYRDVARAVLSAANHAELVEENERLRGLLGELMEYVEKIEGAYCGQAVVRSYMAKPEQLHPGVKALGDRVRAALAPPSTTEARMPENEIDLLNPNEDRCMNCGQKRADHRFTRAGAKCLSGRSFKPDMEALRRALDSPVLDSGGPHGA